jgi:hypothetical protein
MTDGLIFFIAGEGAGIAVRARNYLIDRPFHVML